MAVSDSKEVVYDSEDYTLYALSDAHANDWAILAEGLYTPFSHIKWTERVWLLYGHDGRQRGSVRHSTGEEGDMSDHLYAHFDVIRSGDDPREFTGG